MPTLLNKFNYEYGNIKVWLDAPETGASYKLFRQAITVSPAYEQLSDLTAENNYTFIDNTVEQGETYQYLYTNGEDTGAIVARGETDYITVDFEDIILSDAQRALRIRFNPKVSSFKKVIQEQKIETIGNQFPFFFRNGNIKYREFSISGLISSEMDEFFLNGDNNLSPFRSKTPTDENLNTNSTHQYYNERKFKLEVENWLTNGKPKIFRSPTEGNYIIRLTNVSLSPEDQLSRRLHSFSATAHEIAQFTTLELAKQDLLNFDKVDLNRG